MGNAMSKRPRIAIIDLSFHWPPRGGSWVDIAYIARGLMERGAEIRMFVPRVETGGLKRGRFDERPFIPVTTCDMSLKSFHAFCMPGRLEKAVRKWNPDYVVISNTFSMAPWIVRRLSGFRVILRIYGYEMLCPYYMSLWPHGRIEHWASSNPEAAICTSSYMRSPNRCTMCTIRGMGKDLLPRWMNPFSHEYVASLAFMPFYRNLLLRMFDRCHRILVSNSYTSSILDQWASKVVEVPGGVDTEFFTPDIQDKPSVATGDPIVLMPGRVEDPRKGYSVFRDVVHRLKENGLRFRALITDPRYDGNSPYIESTGWIPYSEMPNLYRRARTIVVPTMWPEPFGLVALESMACGVPVVAHAIGGLSELVLDGKTGFLVTPGDRKSIENKVAELVTHDNQWLTLSRNARRRAEEFDWSNIVSRYYLSLFHLEDNQTNEREDCS